VEKANNVQSQRKDHPEPTQPSTEPSTGTDEPAPDLDVSAPEFDYQTEGADPDQIQEP
jgi:hypothetical protein